jgi:hypothetical protein
VCLARESALITLRPCARISSDPAFRRQLLTARVFFCKYLYCMGEVSPGSARELRGYYGRDGIARRDSSR